MLKPTARTVRRLSWTQLAARTRKLPTSFWRRAQMLMKDALEDSGFTWPSPLMQVVLWSQNELIKCLLVKGADVNAADFHGSTVLMRAVEADNLEAAKLLLAGGADINRRNKDGFTA